MNFPTGAASQEPKPAQRTTWLRRRLTAYPVIIACICFGALFSQIASASAKAPTVTTKPVLAVSTEGATLNGTVNPNGLATKYYFEYGPPGAKTSEVSIGSGSSTIEVTQAISGLTPNTEYGYVLKATNSDGTTTGGLQTFYTGAPKNTVLPSISMSKPLQAVPVSTFKGTWKGSPTSYAYQWERCKGSECEAISGATSSTYTPVEADVGYTLRSKVTAENTIGSTVAYSNPTANAVEPIGNITEYALGSGSEPIGIASGTEGKVWFTNSRPGDASGKIGRITSEGTISEFVVPVGESLGNRWLSAITEGPGGLMWFVSEAADPATMSNAGTVTEYPLDKEVAHVARDVVAGPDGNLWYASWANGGGWISKVTTSGTATKYVLSKDSQPKHIAVGPDGNLWFTTLNWSTGHSKIGKITTSGSVTEYEVAGWPDDITGGPDGNLWFTTEREGAAKIGKITTGGSVTEYSVSSAGQLGGIVNGPDGNLWFTDGTKSQIGRITTSGTATMFALPSESNPTGIAVGPDKYVWFTNSRSGKIGKITP